ncbi:MAG: SUMF1/EgtB/PvdO family nonheme iron enzyme [Symploca sp. SIO1C4]|uniref:SUMF1/EgtB/PvdO family nonheme iron enzyme n=1 Tax=Symploca sp. SIO1C4 TaxID=2607765 RepID=A0A6B3NC35_9CYAN|nr:SUMF1/EgtB/PvdO family nonheme iron enzyme [Symploca sp. SIO1C4]
MPVVRLIQDSMLDQSQQIQVAEVFLGGLLKPIGEITPETDPEQVQYEFIEGVRGELLKSIPVPDSEKVLDQVSRYLARKLGITLKDFVAWLQNPSLIKDKALESMVKPFARVTQEILQQLGYEFAAEKDDTIPSSEELPLETYTFDIAFIERANAIEELTQFSFETVTVNRKGEIINKETKTAQCFIEDLGNGITLDMVYIPGGTFLMGTEDEEIERLCEKYDRKYFRRERPQHQVTVQPFFMGKYPITQGQWKAVASMTHLTVNLDLYPEPSRFEEDPDRGKTRWDRPVEQVSWYDAIEFCRRLSKLTGQEYRLPTEAEWEYACRAVTDKQLPVTSDWSKNLSSPPFHFGETLTDELANYDASFIYAEEPEGKYRLETTSVGSFPANAFGLYDMHGNVFEWCEDDHHKSYENAPIDGSAWRSRDKETTKVIRGGSWGSRPTYCRCAVRIDDLPDDDYYIIGLRVVCAAPRTF